MKHLRLLTLILVVVLLTAVPFVAQADEEEDAPLIGTLQFTDDGIVFIDVEGDVYILAPAGGFNPSEFMDYEEGTLFELEGTIVSEGDDENPPTMQVASLEEYDVDTDTDGDGVPDLEDNCPEDANPIPEGEEAQVDTDGDGIGDECDEFPDVENDSDNDGVADDVDICPEVYNPIEEGATEQVFPVDTDEDGIGDACEEPVDEEEADADEGDGEGGFYCRNRDIEHPAGSRLAEQYEADYSELIGQFCGDDGDHKMGWGLIRRELREDAGDNEHGNRNGNNGNRNGNNGNRNGNNGNRNGNKGNRNG